MLRLLRLANRLSCRAATRFARQCRETPLEANRVAAFCPEDRVHRAARAPTMGRAAYAGRAPRRTVCRLWTVRPTVGRSWSCSCRLESFRQGLERAANAVCGRDFHYALCV